MNKKYILLIIFILTLYLIYRKYHYTTQYKNDIVQHFVTPTPTQYINRGPFNKLNVYRVNDVFTFTDGKTYVCTKTNGLKLYTVGTKSNCVDDYYDTSNSVVFNTLDPNLNPVVFPLIPGICVGGINFRKAGTYRLIAGGLRYGANTGRIVYGQNIGTWETGLIGNRGQQWATVAVSRTDMNGVDVWNKSVVPLLSKDNFDGNSFTGINPANRLTNIYIYFYLVQRTDDPRYDPAKPPSSIILQRSWIQNRIGNNATFGINGEWLGSAMDDPASTMENGWNGNTVPRNSTYLANQTKAGLLDLIGPTTGRPVYNNTGADDGGIYDLYISVTNNTCNKSDNTPVLSVDKTMQILPSNQSLNTLYRVTSASNQTPCTSVSNVSTTVNALTLTFDNQLQYNPSGDFIYFPDTSVIPTNIAYYSVFTDTTPTSIIPIPITTPTSTPSASNNIKFNTNIRLNNLLNANDTYANYISSLNVTSLVDNNLITSGVIYNNNNKKIYCNYPNITLMVNNNTSIIFNLSNPHMTSVHDNTKNYSANFILSNSSGTIINKSIQLSSIIFNNPTITISNNTNKITFAVNPIVIPTSYTSPSLFYIQDNTNPWLNFLLTNKLELTYRNNIFSCTGFIQMSLPINYPSTTSLVCDQLGSMCILNNNNGTYTVNAAITQGLYSIYQLPSFTLTNISIFNSFITPSTTYNVTPSPSPTIPTIPLTFNTITITPTYDNTNQNIIPMVTIPPNIPSTNINALVLSNNSVNNLVYYTDLVISNNTSNITISGSIYVPISITTRNQIIKPYLLCNQFRPILITNIACTNKVYLPNGTNPNQYYFKLSFNPPTKINMNQILTTSITLTNIGIYNTNNTSSPIALFNSFTYIDDSKTLIPPSVSMADTNILMVSNYQDQNNILSEAFTGFDIFGQYNNILIKDFGYNPTDIYKTLYSADPVTSTVMYNNFNIWPERYVTPMLSTSTLSLPTISNKINICNVSSSSQFQSWANTGLDVKILAMPYRYSSLYYQNKIVPTVMLSSLSNGFDINNIYDSILDVPNGLIGFKKSSYLLLSESEQTELNDPNVYIGYIYCSPVIFTQIIGNIPYWPKNSFEVNIAFISYLTYITYNIISNPNVGSYVSSFPTSTNTIKLYKIATPFRLNIHFQYRLDLSGYIGYCISSMLTQTKLYNYQQKTNTLTIDLPNALMLIYYDKNPQSLSDASKTISTQNLLNSYYNNQPSLSSNYSPSTYSPSSSISSNISNSPPIIPPSLPSELLNVYEN